MNSLIELGWVLSGPVTCLIAAYYGLRTWIKYDILITSIITLELIFKPDGLVGDMVSRSNNKI